MVLLKREKENGKAFHFNDIAQILSEICGIFRRQTSNIENSVVRENPSALTTWSKDTCLV